MLSRLHALPRACAVHTRLPAWRGSLLQPRTSLVRRLCTPAAEAAEPKDTRPWPLRYWKSLLFASMVCAWINSLRVSNKTSKLRKTMEDDIEGEAPTNPDELLELRALNDTPSSKIAALPALAAKRLGRRGSPAPETATAPQLLLLLQESVGSELREMYVLERMLMAIATSTAKRKGEMVSTAATDTPIDIRLATATLMFLSSGSVVERLEAMFNVLKQPADERKPAVEVSHLEPLLDSLIATGQVPPEKQVSVIDEGKNALGFGHDWYRVQPVVRLSATDWAAELLQPKAETALKGDEGEAADGQSAQTPVETDLADAKRRIELENFIQMLQGDVVCIWGECHVINERKRQQKLAEELAESARNPSWWTRTWNYVTATPNPSSHVPESSTVGSVSELSTTETATAGGTADSTAGAAALSSYTDSEFHSSASFVGPRPGYVFKKGPQGMGYYKDH